MTRLSPLSLHVGDISLALTCDNEPLSALLGARYQAWQRDAPGACTVAVQVGDRPAPPQRRTPEISFTPEGRCRVTAPGYVGELAPNGAHAQLTIDYPDVAGVDYFLRVALALLAYEAGGLLLHAAGLRRGSATFLFSGPSGIGKSTAARVSASLPEMAVLGDDLILLLPQRGGWRAYGTPFWNPETPVRLRRAQTESGLLRAHFRLAQDPQVYVRPLSRAQAVAGLLADLPIVTLDARRLPTLLGRIGQLAATTPIGELHLRPDPGFWSALDAFLETPPA